MTSFAQCNPIRHREFSNVRAWKQKFKIHSSARDWPISATNLPWILLKHYCRWQYCIKTYLHPSADRETKLGSTQMRFNFREYTCSNGESRVLLTRIPLAIKLIYQWFLFSSELPTNVWWLQTLRHDTVYATNFVRTRTCQFKRLSFSRIQKSTFRVGSWCLFSIGATSLDQQPRASYRRPLTWPPFNHCKLSIACRGLSLQAEPEQRCNDRLAYH